MIRIYIKQMMKMVISHKVATSASLWATELG